jgi:DNA-binding transcriptional regulator LsrR (DeoR family)
MPRPKKKAPDTAAMLEAARLYYEDGKPRLAIAKQLGLDPRDVTWLLQEAKALKLVRIDIMGMARDELSQALIAKYRHLKQVIILAGDRDSETDRLLPVETPAQYQRMLRKWGRATADLLTTLLNRRGDTPTHIGVTGGESILEVVTAMTEQERPNLHIHTTALVGQGRLAKEATHVLPIVTASILWAKAGRCPGRIEYATVPPFPVGKPGPIARAAAWAQLDDMAKQAPIREVIEAMDQIDIALAGVGIVNPPTNAPALRSRITMTEILQNVVTPEQLDKEGAVADLSYNFVSATGQPNDKWRFFLSAGHYSDHPGLRFFQRMVKEGKTVIAIAGSAYKVPGIRAALASKGFNFLVTDEHAATELLK